MALDPPNRAWEKLLGVLAVGAFLSSFPLVRPDLEHLVHIAEPAYKAALIVGLVCSVFALAGILFLSSRLALAVILHRKARWCTSGAARSAQLGQVNELLCSHFGPETPTLNRMKEWHRKNNECFTIIHLKELQRGTVATQIVGAYKLLPLTKTATERLENEQLDGVNFRAGDVVAGNDRPYGVYVGDVVAATQFSKGYLMEKLKKELNEYVDRGIPVYARPLSKDGRRLLRKYRFVPVMPGVPQGTIVGIPGQDERDSGMIPNGVPG